ncbi:MAG: RNA polymerase sigma factor [Pirellulaceae bacterium]|nr:RNA polymerase sigma factor [Pirellulaceae bacterium]
MNTTAGRRHDSDRERITGWYHQHGPAVRGYVLALVHRSDVADDVLQETFRKAWEARDRYQETGLARAYLLRIADRLVCDRARRSGRETTLDGTALELCESGPDSDPTLAMQQSEQRRRLNDALKELSPLQQRVLLLRYYGEMSFADIADTVGCPLSTALSHARRGLSALRKRLVEVV